MHRRMLPEVALESHGPHACVPVVDPLERSEGPVGRAVVDEDQLEGAWPRVERRERPPVQLFDTGDLVEERDDHRDVRCRRLRLEVVLAHHRLDFRHRRTETIRAAGAARIETAAICRR